MLFSRHVPLLSLLASLLLANSTWQHFERATLDQIQGRVEQISEMFDPHTSRESCIEAEVVKSPILNWNDGPVQDARVEAALKDLEEFVTMATPFLAEFVGV